MDVMAPGTFRQRTSFFSGQVRDNEAVQGCVSGLPTELLHADVQEGIVMSHEQYGSIWESWSETSNEIHAVGKGDALIKGLETCRLNDRTVSEGVSAASAASAAASTSVAMTAAPSCAHSCAERRPMPRAAAVISTVFPERRPMADGGRRCREESAVGRATGRRWSDQRDLQTEQHQHSIRQRRCHKLQH